MFLVRSPEVKSRVEDRTNPTEKRAATMASRSGTVLSALRNAVEAPSFSQVGLEMYLRVFEAFRRRGESVFISAMPKSGSTFLAKTLCQVTGFKRARLTYKFGRNEQELYLPKLIDNYGRSIVTQQHTKATLPNIQLFRRFGIRPVIVVRNIFDVVPSIRDYLLKEGVEGFPSLYATEHFRSLPEEEQHDFLITYAIPWYFSFHASWYDAAHNGSIETLWLTYEDLVGDWAAGVRAVLDFYGLDHSEEEVRSTLEAMQQRRQETRINKGVVGRGQSGLTRAQKDRITAMKRFYPWVDFSPIGL
jgi:hypothetical protein